MAKDIYVYTGKAGPVVRTMNFNRGGVVVNIDFNKEREVFAVEVIAAKKLTIDGKTHR